MRAHLERLRYTLRAARRRVFRVKTTTVYFVGDQVFLSGLDAVDASLDSLAGSPVLIAQIPQAHIIPDPELEDDEEPLDSVPAV